MDPTTQTPFYNDTSKYSNQTRANRIASVISNAFGGMDLSDPSVNWEGTRSPEEFFADFYNNDKYGSGAGKTLGRDVKNTAAWERLFNPSSTYLRGKIAQATPENPVDIYNRSLNELGISDARTRVTNLRQQLFNTENLLANVEGDVSARTQDSLVTENQRRRLVGSEQAPLVTQTDTLGRNLGGALEDYGMITDEAGMQAKLDFEGQQMQRQSLMDRLQDKIDRAKTAEEKRRWQAEFNRLKKKDAEATREFNKTFELQQQRLALERQRLSKASASSGGSSGGGAGSGGYYSSSGGGYVSQADAKSEFLNYIAGKFKSAGSNPSRQTQDAWANAWFAQKGVTDPSDRQFYWDSYNSKYNRPENPYSDWLYKR